MMIRTAAALAGILCAAPAFAQDVLVVAPKEFQPATEAWRKHREAQGLAVELREPPAKDDDVLVLSSEVYAKSGRKLRFIVLLGDADKVPCAYRTRKADAGLLGAPPKERIATDVRWGDFDADGIPDVAVGRIPADTPEEAKDYLDRVVAYETSTDFGPWRGRLNVVAGTGGFGPMVDLALENLCRLLLAENVPPSVEVTMTYANPLSPFCPPPANFADYAVNRWSEGALVVAYVGHGSARSVDRVKMGPDEYPILDLAHVERIEAASGAPVSMFIACSTGQFDAPEDCLAEKLLARPKGPVAVIASSRISSPYSNGIVAKEVLDALYLAKSPTVGELLVAVKRRLVNAPEGDVRRVQLEKMAAAMFEKSDEKRRLDREDHCALYNLLGDPCLRIDRPSKLDVEAQGTATAGTATAIAFTAPFDGNLRVVLERGRKAPVRPKLTSKTTPEEFRAVYTDANDRTIAKVDRAVKAGAVGISLEIPADAAAGPCAVRVYLSGDKAAAAGGAELQLVAAPK